MHSNGGVIKKTSIYFCPRWKDAVFSSLSFAYWSGIDFDSVDEMLRNSKNTQTYTDSRKIHGCFVVEQTSSLFSNQRKLEHRKAHFQSRSTFAIFF